MADGEAVVLSATNALGEKVAPVSPLGEAGRVAVTPAVAANDPVKAAAEAAAAAKVEVEKTAAAALGVSRDTKPDLAAAEKALADAKTPEEKTAAQAALDKLKPAVDPAKVAADAAALAAAEKALVDAKTPEEKAAAEKALALLKGTPGVEVRLRNWY